METPDGEVLGEGRGAEIIKIVIFVTSYFITIFTSRFWLKVGSRS